MKNKGIALSFCPRGTFPTTVWRVESKQAHRFALLRQEIKCQGSGNLLGKNMERKESHREKYNSKLKIVNFLKAPKNLHWGFLEVCWKVPMLKIKLLGWAKTNWGIITWIISQSSHRTWREFSSVSLHFLLTLVIFRWYPRLAMP